jgi:hypothetical protein
MNLSTFLLRGTKRHLRAPRRILVVERLEMRNLLSFGGVPYVVGPTVIPRTTPPEATFADSGP